MRENKEIENALNALKAGETILYPTDTVWGIGCDATNPQAVAKVYRLKKRPDSKALICLVADFDMLSNFVKHIPETVIELIKTSKKPTTVIYNAPKGLAKNLIAQDNSIGIRICNDAFCRQLITQFGKPIVSTSANISGQPTPKSFAQIGTEIIKGADYVVNLQPQTKNASPSTIIKVEIDGQIKTIRE